MMNIEGLSRIFKKIQGYSLYLNEIRKNLAANLEQSLLTHSYCYGSASDYPNFFARFPLSFAPFMKHPG